MVIPFFEIHGSKVSRPSGPASKEHVLASITQKHVLFSFSGNDSGGIQIDMHTPDGDYVMSLAVNSKESGSLSVPSHSR